MPEPIDEARRTLDAFIAAFNGRDLDGVRASCNYPHVLVASGGRAVIAASADELTVDFAALEAGEGWHHTTFDDVDVLDASATSVALRFTYSRCKADGSCYFTGRAHYLFTAQDGHWGRQAQLLFDS